MKVDFRSLFLDLLPLLLVARFDDGVHLHEIAALELERALRPGVTVHWTPVPVECHEPALVKGRLEFREMPIER